MMMDKVECPPVCTPSFPDLQGYRCSWWPNSSSHHRHWNRSDQDITGCVIWWSPTRWYVYD